MSQNQIRKPPMGWLSWNMYAENIHEDLIRAMADAMVESGMKDCGYEYIIIDDCWSVREGRDEQGHLVPDPKKFPSGMKALADYVHSKGLKLGIYSDACRVTCAGWPGSYGYEEVDARTFAEWGIDFLKQDYWLDVPEGETAQGLYTRMGEALRNCGREIVYAVCEWGSNEPWKWAHSTGAAMWRTTWDIRDTWDSGIYDVQHNGFVNTVDVNAPLADFAGNGGYNDMDMICAGLYGKGSPANGGGACGCTDTEYQSQMTLWCIMNSPLLTCCDLANMNEATKRILMNREVLAVNQDGCTVQGRRMYAENGFEVFIKPLENGDYAAAVLNRNAEAGRFHLDLTQFGLPAAAEVRDLWAHEAVEHNRYGLDLQVESHETRLLRIRPQEKPCCVHGD